MGVFLNILFWWLKHLSHSEFFF